MIVLYVVCSMHGRSLLFVPAGPSNVLFSTGGDKMRLEETRNQRMIEDATRKSRWKKREKEHTTPDPLPLLIQPMKSSG
jgi:hypothetical protein